MKKLFYLSLITLGLMSCAQKQQFPDAAFPLKVADVDPNRPMSSAMKRAFQHYEAPRLLDNELYTNFKYTELKGFDYNNGDGTISRRDPSKIIFENGQYYVWYTHRETPLPPQGKGNANDTLPSTDWDLAEIWYATSKDGFTWEEQGVAVTRPPKPKPGWRSVATADILKFKGKYYLYYQAFNAPSGTYDEAKDAYDICPVALSVAVSPDGPWTPVNKVVIPFGESNEWDWRVIHDPMPLVHDGKIYLYYKSGMDQRDANRKHWDCWGLAIAEHPEGPFKKHPLSPVMNSGHETMLFPFREGVAAIVGTDGIEHNTIQYAEDWVNFEIASVTQLLPTAGGLFSPDAFTDSKNADGITWGLSHFINAGGNWKKQYSKLGRFDCDLSQSVHDPTMKRSNVLMPNDLYFKYGLTKKQRERIEKENSQRALNQ
ncbi:family 43 glycosylhydrolase [Flammeovirga sp. EKP202]|uniref:glycoside hydrolase family 117 protein n=1 Tax=Flammeovirga sp. EKP202 TaxID=2770592 RepID=UPI00165ED54D|nr:family 43 glycosylhydrolase [Flammeovirga sp. EKP202]MBD0404335.1 family 43 glycosylhydrolase [Flammeovirga sp. EKP202]